MGKATRDAYGETLKRLGSTHPDRCGFIRVYKNIHICKKIS